MDLLLDTHVLVWLSEGDSRTSRAVIAALGDPGTRPRVSAVTAWEYGDLHARGRFPSVASLDEVLQRFMLDVTALPVDVWRWAGALPDYHRDPIDRMLIAHAAISGFALATADRNIHRYPVNILW